MKDVGKYNLFKSISLLLTAGTPLLTMSAFSEFIVYSSKASISVTGMIAILLAALFFKDKIVENFKVPSPFLISAIIFGIIIFVESIMVPMKYTCVATMIACGIDELTFKRMYKQIETRLPEKASAYKKFGFLCCKDKTLRE